MTQRISAGDAENGTAGEGRQVDFCIDQYSGLPPYLQLIRQVRYSLLLGNLREGDRLPTVKEMATRLAINQNTVLKAYRELEFDGLVNGQSGVGTFIRVTMADAAVVANGPLGVQLYDWLITVRQAGLDNESIEAVFVATLRASGQQSCPPTTR